MQRRGGTGRSGLCRVGLLGRRCRQGHDGKACLPLKELPHGKRVCVGCDGANDHACTTKTSSEHPMLAAFRTARYAAIRVHALHVTLAGWASRGGLGCSGQEIHFWWFIGHPQPRIAHVIHSEAVACPVVNPARVSHCGSPALSRSFLISTTSQSAS